MKTTAELINDIINGIDRLIQNIRKLYNMIKNRNKNNKPKK